MSLSSSLVSLGDGTLPESFEGLKSHIPLEWIQKALSERGMATVRKRKLPMETVVWLVIGMALYRDRPIGELVRRLELVWPGKDGKPQDVTDGAIPQARDRVGARPLGELFRATGRRWAEESAKRHEWRGLKVLGVDGTTLAIPDTPDNRNAFGGPRTASRTAGYPMVRLSALVVLRSHVVWDVAFGHFDKGEPELMERMMRDLPEDSLTILDRGYNSHALLQHVGLGKGRHWLVRWRDGSKWKRVKSLGRGEEIVEMTLSPKTRAKNPDVRPVYLARMIRYQKPGFRAGVFLTSLLDAKRYPRREIVDLYYERWEIEMAYDEVKTQELEGMDSIRSRTAEGVKQEIYGLMTAYNLVRREMECVAASMKLRVIRDLFWWSATASPGALPKMVERMRLEMRHVVLPERRTGRRFPREIKRWARKYPHKPGHPLVPKTEKGLI
jgi:hypothetical protein